MGVTSLVVVVVGGWRCRVYGLSVYAGTQGAQEV